MKTLTITEERGLLGYWLKRAAAGEDIGFMFDGKNCGLAPQWKWSPRKVIGRGMIGKGIKDMLWFIPLPNIPLPLFFRLCEEPNERRRETVVRARCI
jgi:hypothetical protein